MCDDARRPRLKPHPALWQGGDYFITCKLGRKIMSRGRDNRDDEEMGSYGGSSSNSGGRRRSSGSAFDDRYGGSDRVDYGRAGYRERDYSYDDPYRAARGRGGGGGERLDYGRGGYNDRATDYGEDERRYGDSRGEREAEERSWVDEGRDYLRRT